jgi:hypothetical protein
LNWKEVFLLIVLIGISGFYCSRILSIIEHQGFTGINFTSILDAQNGLTFYGGYIPIFIGIFTFVFFKLYKIEEINKLLS